MKKVIIVTGTTSSGSTMLNRMLGNSPAGFSVGEIHALFWPFRPPHLLKSNKCYCNDNQCSFWGDIKNGGEKKVYKHLFEKLCDVNFMVESSKDILWIKKQIKYIKKNNYELIPIIIYKTPLEYAYSLYKRNISKEFWYGSWITSHLRLFYVIDDFLTVKFRDLVIDPAKKLQKICNKIGINYFKGKEKFWNDDFTHFLFGSRSSRTSKKIVYYEDHYEHKKLDYVKNYIPPENKMIKQILSILEEYEVDSNKKIDNSIVKLKEKIKKFQLRELVKMKSFSTHYYSLNCCMKKVCGVVQKTRFF